MRVATVLALLGGLMLLPYFGYASGLAADDQFGQRYMWTFNGVRDRVATFSPKYNYDYEKNEISTTLAQWTGVVTRFVVTLPQRVHV